MWLLGLLAWRLLSLDGLAQSTAFTYQGQLNVSSSPANGLFDLSFALYPTNLGGNPVGTVLTNTSVAVSNGLFLTTLDFGAAFRGAADWLEIGVRSHGSSNALVTLIPRQNLTAAPYALYAFSADTLTTNTFAGDGSGLTNLTAANMNGLGTMAFQPTNGAAVSGMKHYGMLNIQTNSAFPTSGLTLANFCSLTFGSGGSVYNNPAHGPGDEIQFTAQRRLALLFGYSFQHNDALQIGASSFGYVQGAACPVYFNGDKWPQNAADPLGYSLLTDYHIPYFGNGPYGNSTGNGAELGWRGEAVDTNGGAALVLYSVSNPNPLVGQSPGAKVGVELWTNGMVSHGRFTSDLPELSPGANFGVSWDAPVRTELALSADLTITNVPLTYARTNQADTRVLYFYPGPYSWNITFPTNWFWESNSVANGAPTNVPGSVILKVEVEMLTGNATSYLARARYYPYATTLDADALAFFMAANITNTTRKNALNALCLNAKNHGYWSKLIALYPFVGDTGNGATNGLDLKAAHCITWHGILTHNAGGVTGDGATGYGNTGIVPAAVFTSPNSGMVFVWIKGPALPNDQGWFIGALDYSPAVYAGISRAGNNLVVDGLNALSAVDGCRAAGGSDFTGLAAANRTSGSSQYSYVNGTLGGSHADTIASGSGGNEPIYILARNANGATDHFSNANLSAAGVGQNFTTSDMMQLTADLNAFESALGR